MPQRAKARFSSTTPAEKGDIDVRAELHIMYTFLRFSNGTTHAYALPCPEGEKIFFPFSCRDDPPQYPHLVGLVGFSCAFLTIPGGFAWFSWFSYCFCQSL